MPPAARTDAGRPIADAFRAHQRYLWGLAYRMTGSSADADDIVQESFARAVERPPAREDLPLRPWLTAVVLNLARDALRARRRRAYVGPWLPAAVDSAELDAIDIPGDAAGAEARYDLAESASFAFLLALEALNPQQRAVLILRDVLDYSVRETAEVLAFSEGNVKTTHHRARHAMQTYDERRRPLTPELAAQTQATLERFVGALFLRDIATAESLMVRDVRALSDGGGEYAAALRPIEGRDRVVRFLAGLRQKATGPAAFELRSVNRLPALVVELEHAPGRLAPRFVLRCDVDAEGHIGAVHIVSASPKMARVGPLAADAMRA